MRAVWVGSGLVWWDDMYCGRDGRRRDGCESNLSRISVRSIQMNVPESKCNCKSKRRCTRARDSPSNQNTKSKQTQRTNRKERKKSQSQSPIPLSPSSTGSTPSFRLAPSLHTALSAFKVFAFWIDPYVRRKPRHFREITPQPANPRLGIVG